MQRPKHLLTGLAKCGVCGSSYVKVGKKRFGCAGAKDRGTCTNKRTIDGAALEAVVLDALRTQLLSADSSKSSAPPSMPR